MNATRRLGFALTAATLMAGAAGCGAGASPAQIAGPSKSPPPSYDRGGEPSAESQAFGQPGLDSPGDFSPSAPPAAGATSREAPHRDDASASRRPEAKERPGLGTEWGETRTSHISSVPFQRASLSSPFATTSFLYNDEEGARAMANMSGFRRTAPNVFASAGGLVSIGLRDESGRFLSGFVAGGQSYVVGEAGRRYSIVVHNNTDVRLEVVLSVDGLDVLDGKPASFTKRGYLVDARGELEVDGFRQSEDAVAAFRFGSVRDSYAAQKHGDTRNVGVIGVALFNERGTHPFPWSPGEVQRRRDANPFPGQFATPP